MDSITERAPASRRLHAVAATAAAHPVRLLLRLLAVCLLLVPVYGFLQGDSALAARLSVFGLLGITLVRPGDGLLLCAALLPISPMLNPLLGSQVPLREPMLFAFFAGCVVRGRVRPQPPLDEATRKALTPAWLFALVVAGSMATELMVRQAFVAYPWPFVRELIGHLARPAKLETLSPALFAGLLMLETIGLFAAVIVLCRREASLSRRLTRMAAVGGAAVAAFSLFRLAEISLRYPGLFQTLVVHPRNIRISPLYPDVNAAGSGLAMTLLVVVGLGGAARRSRWFWALAGVVCLVALWFNGSRTASAAAIVSGAVVFAWLTRRDTRKHLKRLLAGITLAFVVVLATDWFAAGYASRYDFNRAYIDRAEFSLAALRAFADHPVFGVGVGQFWSVSSNYILRPEVRAVQPQENAHNNFLQILAELGAAGFVFFVWLLVAVGRRSVAALTSHADPALAGVFAGLVAFLLTSLFGHPLLTADIAVAFWLVLGLLVALSLELGPGPLSSSLIARRAEIGLGPIYRLVSTRRRAVALVAVCLLVSAPIRARQFLNNEADLQLAAVGLSRWNFDDVVRYRTMKGRAYFYVPADTCAVAVALRVDPAEAHETLEVEIRLDDQPANAVRATRDSWRDARLVMWPQREKRFRKIELRTVSGDGTLRTGKPLTDNCGGKPF